MKNAKKLQENLKEAFEKEDKLLNKIQSNLEQVRKDGEKSPDILDQFKKQQKNKKVALPDADSSV